MKIIVLDGVTLNPGDNPWTEMGALGALTVYERTPPEQVVDRAAAAPVLVVNKIRLDRSVLEQLDELRFVAVTATGHDCVDSAAARERGVLVANVPVYGTDSVAQHIFALLLHLIHRVDLHDAAIREGQWSECGDFSFWCSPLTELSGKTFGVIGYGRIGRRVAQLAAALGMHVVVHSRRRGEDHETRGVTWVDLPELMRRSDVISLNCPLTEATAGMIDRDRLAEVKPTAILLNASRGQLVNETDLANALNSGRLAGAALDVVAAEPIAADNPLLSARNCFLTPHLAWATIEARRRLMQVSVENVRQFLAGSPQNIVG